MGRRRTLTVSKEKYYTDGYFDLSKYRKIYRRLAYLKNRKKELAQVKRYRILNSKKVYLGQIAWAKKNPIRHYAKNLNFNYRKKGLIERISVEALKKVLSKTNNVCFYCHVTFSKKVRKRWRTIDHFNPIFPKNKKIPKGDNSIKNLVPCCMGCNQSKAHHYSGKQFLRIISK